MKILCKHLFFIYLEYLIDMHVETLPLKLTWSLLIDRRDSSDTSGPKTSSYMERLSLIDVMTVKRIGN